MELKEEFLRLLLKKDALRIASSTDSLFVFKSGRKSPNFINLRAMTDGESQAGLKKAYATFIKQLLDEGKIGDFDFIFGPAYAAINLACLACEGLYEMYGMNKRYLYDRKESKGYGDKGMDDFIVGSGHFTKGARILIIDDVITTGAKKLESIEKLSLLGDHTIVGLVLAVDRQEKMGDDTHIDPRSAAGNMASMGIPNFSILDMESIFLMVKDSLKSDIKQAWMDYYDRYGIVKLRD
ncbi:MAG: hypothetical protein HYY37_01360 [Candidatus Aenigmarchaeota archaeon]|nr:hypothetical protein [Candidatus Aenigmarchaeota archaeon]